MSAPLLEIERLAISFPAEAGRVKVVDRVALAIAPGAFPIPSLAGISARHVGEDAAAIAYLDRAARVRPDSWTPAYDRACLAAVRGRRDEAFAWLDRAAEKGFRDVRLAESDADLASLRDDPRFAQFRGRVAAAETSRRSRRPR